MTKQVKKIPAGPIMLLLLALFLKPSNVLSTRYKWTFSQTVWLCSHWPTYLWGSSPTPGMNNAPSLVGLFLPLDSKENTAEPRNVHFDQWWDDRGTQQREKLLINCVCEGDEPHFLQGWEQWGSPLCEPCWNERTCAKGLLCVTLNISMGQWVS